MPITKKDFEDGNFKTYRGAALKVMEFLRNNKENAYTSKEIAESIGASQAGATIALRNLIKANIVEAKKPYYILKISASSKKKIVKKDEESEEESLEEVEEE